MAEFYTNLYAAPANAPGATPIYRGPYGGQPGERWSVYATFANTVANPFGASASDQLHICEVPEGTKLVGLAILPSADGDTNNDFTFNLGFTAALTGFAAASTGLQAATAFTLAASAIINIAASRAGDKSELLLNRAAGSLEAAATYHILADFMIP